MTNINEVFREMEAVVHDIASRQEFLEESLAKKALELEDIGWVPLNTKPGAEEGAGLELEDLKRIAPKLRDAAGVDPLHVRGAELRAAYIFGKGINFNGLSNTKAEKAIRDPYNVEALFSPEAYVALNLAKFTDGNVFVIRDEKTNVCMVVPIFEIAAYVQDPDDRSRVRYFLREWHNGRDVIRRWYPVSRFKKSQVGRGKRGKINKTIQYEGKPVPVAQDAVMYHATTNRQVGWAFGVPDSLAAAVWSVAYRDYLSNNALLVKALQQFAWAVTTSTKAGHNNAGLAVASPGVGGIATMGSGNTLGSVGVPSAQVDFNKGQPLAALVATSFGVPVTALLSSPGASGGTYGAVATLDTPTVLVMGSEQSSWAMFYQEILQDMGAPDAEVVFPNIKEDEIYRTVQSIGIAQADGRLWREEAREKTIELLDIRKTRDGLPKPDEFNAGGEINDRSNPMPSQGNSGATPGGVNMDDTDHSMDGDSD